LKVYSFMTFFNECDLFSMRVAEEGRHVDKIVVVEADMTFSGRPKTFHFDAALWGANKKIDYWMISYLKSPPGNATVAERENPQKDYARRKYVFAADDVVIHSDLDEVPHEAEISRIVDMALRAGFVACRLPCYYYFLDAYRGVLTEGLFAVRGDIASEFGFNDLRFRARRVPGYGHVPEPQYEIIKGGHFSYLMSPLAISEKMRSYSHIEYSGPEFSDSRIIQARIDRLEDPVGRGTKLQIVPIGDTHPRTISENWDFWKRYAYKGKI